MEVFRGQPEESSGNTNKTIAGVQGEAQLLHGDRTVPEEHLESARYQGWKLEDSQYLKSRRIR